MDSIVFPGYTLLSELGHGGLSTVYLAQQDVLSREVAFKVMSAAMARQEGFGERFLREAHIVASLNHRNIVQVYDTGEVDGNYYLAMEYLPRGDLTAVAGQPIPVPDTLRVVSSVLEALEFAASRGVVHRDVKPANIMFRDDGTIVLVDFGIAFRDEPEERVTKIGTIIGTPRYMSPEQFDGEDVDHRSDIYSVGIVLFELLTGTVPFDGNSAVDIGIAHRSAPVPQLPDQLNAFQPILDTALAKHPNERFGNAGEFLSALSGLSGSVYAGAAGSDTDFNAAAHRDDEFLERLMTATGEVPAENRATRVVPGRGGDIADTPATVALGDDDYAATLATSGASFSAGEAIADSRHGTSVGALSQPVIAGLGLLIVALVIVVGVFVSGGSDPADDVVERSDAPTPPETVVTGNPGVDDELRVALEIERDAMIDLVIVLSPLDEQLSIGSIEARYAALIANESRLSRDGVLAAEQELNADFRQLLRRSERRIIVGSTKQEVDSAFLICKAIDPDCERSWYASETLRQVRLKPFRLAGNEVSIADFRQFVRATGYITEAETRGESASYIEGELMLIPGLSWQRPFAGNDPVNDYWPVAHISAEDAKAYCEWSGGRLPSAEEWEYAARGPERRIYTWGDVWDPSMAPINRQRPEEVGSLEQDAFFTGVSDLTGSVWEWVTLSNNAFALKGGSYQEFNPANMRAAASRDPLEGLTTSDDGVRCAFDAQEWPESRASS